MFAETLRQEAYLEASKRYTSKSYYTPYMVQNKLHEEDLPVAPMLHCEKNYVVVVCPYCPMTHLHDMTHRNTSQFCFGSSHCCKGDYKFGDLITGENIRGMLKFKQNVKATKAVYRKKVKETKTTQ
jgi:hypothetical protein